MKAGGGESELAGDLAARDDVAGVVIKGVELALIERLADEREVERGVVDAPADGNFRGVVAEGKEVGGEAGASHGALREAVPVGAQASLEHEEFGKRPSVLEVAAGLGVGDVRCG